MAEGNSEVRAVQVETEAVQCKTCGINVRKRCMVGEKLSEIRGRADAGPGECGRAGGVRQGKMRKSSEAKPPKGVEHLVNHGSDVSRGYHGWGHDEVGEETSQAPPKIIASSEAVSGIGEIDASGMQEGQVAERERVMIEAAVGPALVV